MTEPTYPPPAFVRIVGSSGNIGYSGKLIQVGMRWAGATLRIIPIGNLVHIYCNDLIIRTLTINPDHYYQGLTRQPNPNRKEPTSTTRTTTVR